MGMYALIENARTEAMDAANCWYESDEAMAILEKIDAYERLADLWYSECPLAASGFTEAARDAEYELECLRDAALAKVADAYSERGCDAWDEARDAADEDAPPLKQILAQGRRNYVGNAYLERFRP
jgi:hypothetical protein